MSYSLTLCHMYPDLLNLYGDRGNVLSLIRRASLHDIDLRVETISLSDEFNASKYDLVFLGGGQDTEQNMLRGDFVNNKGPEVKRAIEDGVVFLCVCGGYQMLGKYYEEHDGTRIECLGALDLYTVGEDVRFIQDTIYEVDFLPNVKQMTNSCILYGFENHSGRTYLGSDVKPLARVIRGAGNNGEDGFEGAHYNNVICTYSHGSFLPKNPAMTDYLLRTALVRKYGEEVTWEEVEAPVEMLAREAVAAYLGI
ncbi:MAG TPA: glutamine amidotransferase [Bacillota bacterium]|nr:glutamine amidotransferase [Bacillota bacterium]HPE38568.1 glutamine amidotransferase [Bacillota bacterium]